MTRIAVNQIQRQLKLSSRNSASPFKFQNTQFFNINNGFTTFSKSDPPRSPGQVRNEII